jgi:hypothetical protein
VTLAKIFDVDRLNASASQMALSTYRHLIGSQGERCKMEQLNGRARRRCERVGTFHPFISHKGPYGE